MKKINEFSSIDNTIDNNEYINIDITNNGKYSLKRGFKPETIEAITAEEIASALDDLENYAFYYSVVNKIGWNKARELLSEVKCDVRKGELKGKLIENPGALYTWKYKDYLGKKSKENNENNK